MTKEGRILELYIAKEGKQLKQSRLTLDEYGVRNDKHYKKDPARSVLIASISSYELAHENDIELKHGDLGENILVDFDPYSLTPGTRLKVGHIELEISQMGTLCPGLSKVNSKLPKLLKHNRGIFAKVIVSGDITPGDTITVL
jgi:MOSC domain-containing protein YiiM